MNKNRAQITAGAHHAFERNKRRRGDDAVGLQHLIAHARPVADVPGRCGDVAMRRHAQQPVSQLALEAVHHGEDDDKRRDPQRDTGQRNSGNKGHKTRATLCA